MDRHNETTDNTTMVVLQLYYSYTITELFYLFNELEGELLKVSQCNVCISHYKNNYKAIILIATDLLTGV